MLVGHKAADDGNAAATAATSALDAHLFARLERLAQLVACVVREHVQVAVAGDGEQDGNVRGGGGGRRDVSDSHELCVDGRVAERERGERVVVALPVALDRPRVEHAIVGGRREQIS